MKSILIALALTSAAWGGSLTIDSFDDPQGPLTGNGSTGVQSIADGIQRQLLVSGVGGSGPILTGMVVADGLLDMTTGTDDSADMRVLYILPALPIPADASNLNLVLYVRESDGNLSMVTLGGITGGTITIPGNSADVEYSASFGGSLPVSGVLTLDFTGEPGWDLAIESLGLTWDDGEVPEPSTLLLSACGFALLMLRALRR